MKCGFWVGQTAQAMGDMDNKALIDTEMADMLSRFSIAVCVCGAPETLSLAREAWPRRMSSILEPSSAEPLCSEFMEDLSMFEELSEMPAKPAIHKTIHDRHCMNLVANKQYAASR